MENNSYELKMRFFALAVATIISLLTPPSVAQVPGNCGLQLGGPVIFCDTFDNKNPGIPSRTGDLDPNVWGVSRAVGAVNFGQGWYNGWAATTTLHNCNGTATVAPPNDVMICNGKLHESTNDNPTGEFEAGGVTILAMYPKQPFDFAGRTGTVSFDVSNDSHGTHAAWPEFWITNLPVPAPFNHFDAWQALPQHGLGVRFAAAVPAGSWGSCPNGNNLDKRRWTVDSAVIVRNYVMDDTVGLGGVRTNMAVQQLDCVIAPSDNSGITNHVELKVSQNQIDVFATDAGVVPSLTTLRHIAVVTNTNLSFTRGLIWLEDVHYNADKAETDLSLSQRSHTFVWNNVAFDGPFTYRDFSYDALDALQPILGGMVNLGKISLPNQTASWNVLNMPANPQAAAVRVLFNFHNEFNPAPTVLNVIVNGHAHPTPWPYPDKLQNTWRTFAVTIPITDLVPGTNVVQLGSDQAMVSSNVNIVLVDVPGGVPILPGSNNAYPGGVAPPSQVNGVCGSANGTTVSIAPTTNLCAAGTASPVSGTGPWSWSCAGSSGGATAACSANKTAMPPPVANCGLSSPAFCDTFNQGPSAIRGRGGDLDPAKWATSRLSGEIITSGYGTANPVPIAPIPQCRAGITQTSVYPPNDTLICDPSGTKSQQLMTAVSMQNYGVNSYMPRQPFDFAGRTGKIVFDVDAVSHPLGGYISLEITDDPVPATTFREFQNYEVGPVPKNGLMLRFADVCSGGAAPTNTMVYNNYVGVIVTPTFDHTNGCSSTSQGSLNHFEIQISQSHIDVYGSDFSTDNGQTFPNYKLLYSANINLPFTRGYVHFSAKNHASVKYGFGPDAVFHWDNLGFDGPIISAPRAYEIFDNTTTVMHNDAQNQNLGWWLLDATAGGAVPGIYDPTNKVNSLVFNGVDVSGITSATLTMNAHFSAYFGTPNATWGISYRFNGGAWRSHTLTPGDLASINAIPGAALGILAWALDIPTTDIVAGNNTLEIIPVNAPMGYPPVITNIDLLVETMGMPPPPQPPTVLLAASPASVTLRWSSTDATSCVASGGWLGTKPTSGTTIISPPSTIPYTLTCTGPGGTSSMTAN